MMYAPLMNEIALLKTLIFMFGFITVTLLITGLLCLILDYIDSRED